MKRKIQNLLVSLDNIKINPEYDSDDELIKKIEELRKKDNITPAELQELRNAERKLTEFYNKKVNSRDNSGKQENSKKNVSLNKNNNEKKINKKEEEPKEGLLYDISISENEMECFISFYNITPEYRITYDDIIELLAKNKVTKGILEDNIKKIISDMHKYNTIEGVLAAKGREPGRGKDGYIKYYLKNNKELEERYKKNNKSNNKRWRFIINYVKRGDVLAEKVPAEKGSNGYTVTGKVLEGLRGIDSVLHIKRNVKLINNKYISEIDGEAVIEDMTIRVRKYSDGHFKINISPDKMEVKINIFPAVGDGLPVTVDNIKKELALAGINGNFDDKLLSEKIEECEHNKKAVYDITVLKGIPPVNGKDGFVEYIVKPGTGKNFKIMPDGRVDYKERDLITTVKENDLIAIEHYPEEGRQNGRDVFGNVIEARPGKTVHLKIGKNIYNKEFNDRVEYYSKIDGHLKADDDMLYVLPVYIHDGNVDLAIGNINFPGDVIIQGDVLDDFKVIAEGDIFINGNVGAAVVKSERSIIVKKGVMGKSAGYIYAGGSLAAKFLENAIVETAGNIVVERAIINSNVFSNSIVSVLLEKGQITGGHVAAGRRVEAKVIGSPSGIKTEISVGFNFILKKELENIKIKKQKLESDLIKVEDILQQLFVDESDIRKFTDEMKQLYVESIRKKTIIINELNKLHNSEKNIATADIVVSENPEIVVYDYIYSDVKINFLHNSFITRDKHIHVKIKHDSDKNVIFDMLL